MEIKDENITKLMQYFDDTFNAVEKALEHASESYKMGLITFDTFKDFERDAYRLTSEHAKIRNILFGTEAR